MLGARCPSRDELFAYVVGTLPEESAEVVGSHVETCVPCQAALATLDDAGDALLAGLRRPRRDEALVGESQCREALRRAEALAGAPPASDARAAGPGTQTAPPLPHRLGEYRVLDKLGQGGMGTVYKAIHTELDRIVALKVLPLGSLAGDRAVARFQREIKAAGRLDHPNLVRTYDARETEGMRFLVMEYVDGLDLSELVGRVGPLPVADACEIIRQAALGLQSAHEKGLVHRDIKPSNLMLAREGQVKVLDLGLARIRADQPAGQELTDSGQAMGTADYMAPEQVSDSRAADVRADVYSLGCTLYKLLTGHAPFSGPEYDSAYEKMKAHVEQPVPSIKDSRDDVPDGLIGVLDRILAKDPAERFAAPGDVAEAMAEFASAPDLAGLLAGAMERPGSLSCDDESRRGSEEFLTSAVAGTHASRSFGDEPPPSSPSRRRKLWYASSGLLLLAVGTAVIWLVIRQLSQPIRTTPEPLHPPPGAPLSQMALVSEPAPIKGVLSWTIETRGHRDWVRAVVYSPDAQLLATGAHDGTVRLWDAETAGLVRVLVGHDDGVLSVGWSPTGKTLASGSRDQTIQIWDVPSGRLLRTIRTSHGKCKAVAWSPSGGVLACGGFDGSIALWDVSSGKMLHQLPQHRQRINSLAWSPDGKTLASAASDATARLWDAKSGKQRLVLEHPAVGNVDGVAWSPDGAIVASCCGSRRGEEFPIRLWNAQTGELLASLPAHAHGDVSVAWSPDGKRLLAGGAFQDWNLRVWDTQRRELLLRHPRPARMSQDDTVGWSPDDTTFAAALNNGTVHVCDATSGRLLRILPGYADTSRSDGDSPEETSRPSGNADRAVAAGCREVVLQNGQWVTFSADGHYRGPPGIEKLLVYVVQTAQGQETLSPAEFAGRYGWKNDPGRVKRD